jgi:ribonucleotide monophosphatase NagD (HAD superfamily)
MKDFQGIIFDIDGVLTFQGLVYPGAVDTIDLLRSRGFVLRFLTKSTLKSRASCAQKLRQSGVRATYIGKPHRFAYKLTLRSMRLENSQVIAVGDRASTDIQGVNRSLTVFSEPETGFTHA